MIGGCRDDGESPANVALPPRISARRQTRELLASSWFSGRILTMTRTCVLELFPLLLPEDASPLLLLESGNDAALRRRGGDRSTRGGDRLIVALLGWNLRLATFRCEPVNGRTDGGGGSGDLQDRPHGENSRLLTCQVFSCTFRYN
jgi:hypothetical protein